jgi:hypothetical protein
VPFKSISKLEREPDLDPERELGLSMRKLKLKLGFSRTTWLLLWRVYGVGAAVVEVPLSQSRHLWRPLLQVDGIIAITTTIHCHCQVSH